MKCFAISGLGSIGNIALAARYAEKMYYDKFKYTGGVYFLNGDNDAVLHNGYIDLAIYQLHIKAAKNEKQIENEIKGKRVKIDGYLEDFALTREEADNLIMAARNIVFKD